ncbi:MAG: GNAT family N-acetyltransferase [Chitinophagaceae bacterium]|nr:GNAT family N-acetyltransferase [Chitinophagaceae bacterium]
MILRAATQTDKPAIIELLKLSLGESVIPITEKFWLWKHEQNAFGPSFVLLAQENDEIIGVRAFMQWHWLWNGKMYKAIRAVDTATHPSHQGKGIFKKLTLQQVEKCKQQGIHFVFNTPNEQSMPGYLKMGWEKQGRMPLKLKFTRPISLGYSKFFDKEKYAESVNEDLSPGQQWDGNIIGLFNSYNQPATDFIRTSITGEYISWRYAENPLYRYNYFTDGKNYVLVSRIKNHSFTRELRIVDFILLNEQAKNRSVNSHMKKEVLDFAKKYKIDFISFSGQQYLFNKSYFQWMGIIPVRTLGPLVTVRDLNMQEQFAGLLDIKNWNYSLGDMELF